MRLLVFPFGLRKSLCLAPVALHSFALLVLWMLVMWIHHFFFGVADSPLSSTATTSLGTALIAIGIAPFLEEAFFRGFLLPSLVSRLPTWLAITLQALLFASLHQATMHSLYFQWSLVAGLYLGCLAYHRKAWGIGAFSHCVVNILSLYPFNY